MMPISFPYLDDGNSQALPVIFLHAFPYHSGMWDAQRAALREKGRFIAFDARGLGARKAETTAYMLEHTVDDLFALLDHLAISRCVLCGVSMGGYAALGAAARAPERIAGLLLSNTQAGADSDAAKLGRAEGVRSLLREGVGPFAEAQIQRQLSPHTHASHPQLAQKLRAMAESASVEGVVASLVAIATRTDQVEALGAIRAKTLVIAGADDAVTPPKLAQVMAEHIPQAALHVLPQTGHLANLESEEAFTRLLLELVSSIR
jgi:pimeloyl-ACP methyl ester carboxylesterase